LKQTILEVFGEILLFGKLENAHLFFIKEKCVLDHCWFFQLIREKLVGINFFSYLL
jgi:hypothetical protein